MIRPYNMATRAAPFDSLRIDDVGDVATGTFDKNDSIARIEAFIDDLLQHDLVTVAMGGDHLPFLTCGRWPRSTARWAWCTSMPIPTSMTTCSARRSPAPFRAVGDCSMAIGLSRSVCGNGLCGRRRLVASRASRSCRSSVVAALSR